MAFFEQIGRRILDARQGVAQQTRNLADVTRLNSQISEKKKEMSQLLWEMGQDYYKKHKRDTNCEEQKYIDRLNYLLAEVSQLMDEVDQIKNIRKCPECGAELSLEDSFCTCCGAKVGVRKNAVSSPIDATVTCPACGMEVSAENHFCNYCGTKIV